MIQRAIGLHTIRLCIQQRWEKETPSMMAIDESVNWTYCMDQKCWTQIIHGQLQLFDDLYTPTVNC
jgi:hypothetical protein